MHDDIDVQLAFEHSVLTQTLADVFVETTDMKARLGVYRRNFMQGHCKALKKTFAMTAECLGDIFDSLAVSYICQNRPKAGQLFVTFGDSFPEFLNDETARELARLEWELQTVIMVALDEGQIPTEPEHTHWQLRSDVRLFQSKCNVGEIYRDLKSIGKVEDIAEGNYYYIISRKHETPVIHSLIFEEYVVLEQLRTPHPVDELLDKLTFSQEVIVNILPKVFNVNFLRGADVHTISDSNLRKNV
jgi:hypothetical protein